MKKIKTIKIKRIDSIQVWKKYIYIANENKIIKIKIKEIINDKTILTKMINNYKNDKK